VDPELQPVVDGHSGKSSSSKALLASPRRSANCSNTSLLSGASGRRKDSPSPHKARKDSPSPDKARHSFDKPPIAGFKEFCKPSPERSGSTARTGPEPEAEPPSLVESCRRGEARVFNGRAPPVQGNTDAKLSIAATKSGRLSPRGRSKPPLSRSSSQKMVANPPPKGSPLKEQGGTNGAECSPSKPLTPTQPSPDLVHGRNGSSVPRKAHSEEPLHRQRSNMGSHNDLRRPLVQSKKSVPAALPRHPERLPRTDAGPVPPGAGGLTASLRDRAEHIAANQLATLKDREDSLLRLLDGRQQRARAVM